MTGAGTLLPGRRPGPGGRGRAADARAISSRTSVHRLGDTLRPWGGFENTRICEAHAASADFRHPRQGLEPPVRGGTSWECGALKRSVFHAAVPLGDKERFLRAGKPRPRRHTRGYKDRRRHNPIIVLSEVPLGEAVGRTPCSQPSRDTQLLLLAFPIKPSLDQPPPHAALGLKETEAPWLFR